MTGDMIGYHLKVGTTYKLTMGLVMSSHSPTFEVIGKVTSVEVQGEYSVVYGVRTEGVGDVDRFGYLWDVPRWATQFHMRILRAEEVL